MDDFGLAGHVVIGEGTDGDVVVRVDLAGQVLDASDHGAYLRAGESGADDARGEFDHGGRGVDEEDFLDLVDLARVDEALDELGGQAAVAAADVHEAQGMAEPGHGVAEGIARSCGGS